MEMILALKAEGTAMIGVFHDRDALLALSDTRYDLVLGTYCGIDEAVISYREQGTEFEL